MNNYRVKTLRKLEINSLKLNVKFNTKMIVNKRNFNKKKVSTNL